jgi:nucleotide-binding universal stress UspA family protein
MESGLPVLVGPQDNTGLDARNIIVAWKDTRECRRAIWDALPFLKRAKMVFLLHIIEGGDQSDAETSLQSVARRLERHGVPTEIHVVEGAGARTSDSLCDGADRHGADLIVIGAYGHSRLREWVLGGVTQDFINYASQFVLFSR